jgi:hypothetical protein
MAAEKTPRVRALAGLAVYASLMEALLKHGINKQDDVGAITKEAANSVPGFCTGFGAEVEKEAKHLLTGIGNPAQKESIVRRHVDRYRSGGRRDDLTVRRDAMICEVYRRMRPSASPRISSSMAAASWGMRRFKPIQQQPPNCDRSSAEQHL